MKFQCRPDQHGKRSMNPPQQRQTPAINSLRSIDVDQHTTAGVTEMVSSFSSGVSVVNTSNLRTVPVTVVDVPGESFALHERVKGSYVIS
jgi:hypothetical protein